MDLPISQRKSWYHMMPTFDLFQQLHVYMYEAYY